MIKKIYLITNNKHKTYKRFFVLQKATIFNRNDTNASSVATINKKTTCLFTSNRQREKIEEFLKSIGGGEAIKNPEFISGKGLNKNEGYMLVLTALTYTLPVIQHVIDSLGSKYIKSIIGTKSYELFVDLVKSEVISDTEKCNSETARSLIDEFNETTDNEDKRDILYDYINDSLYTLQNQAAPTNIYGENSSIDHSLFFKSNLMLETHMLGIGNTTDGDALVKLESSILDTFRRSNIDFFEKSCNEWMLQLLVPELDISSTINIADTFESMVNNMKQYILGSNLDITFTGKKRNVEALMGKLYDDIDIIIHKTEVPYYSSVNHNKNHITEQLNSKLTSPDTLYINVLCIEQLKYAVMAVRDLAKKKAIIKSELTSQDENSFIVFRELDGKLYIALGKYDDIYHQYNVWLPSICPKQKDLEVLFQYMIYELVSSNIYKFREVHCTAIKKNSKIKKVGKKTETLIKKSIEILSTYSFIFLSTGTTANALIKLYNFYENNRTIRASFYTKNFNKGNSIHNDCHAYLHKFYTESTATYELMFFQHLRTWFSLFNKSNTANITYTKDTTYLRNFQLHISRQEGVSYMSVIISRLMVYKLMNDLCNYTMNYVKSQLAMINSKYTGDYISMLTLRISAAYQRKVQIKKRRQINKKEIKYSAAIAEDANVEAASVNMVLDDHLDDRLEPVDSKFKVIAVVAEEIRNILVECIAAGDKCIATGGNYLVDKDKYIIHTLAEYLNVVVGSYNVYYKDLAYLSFRDYHTKTEMGAFLSIYMQIKASKMDVYLPFEAELHNLIDGKIDATEHNATKTEQKNIKFLYEDPRHSTEDTRTKNTAMLNNYIYLYANNLICLLTFGGFIKSASMDSANGNFFYTSNKKLLDYKGNVEYNSEVTNGDKLIANFNILINLCKQNRPQNILDRQIVANIIRKGPGMIRKLKRLTHIVDSNYNYRILNYSYSLAMKIVVVYFYIMAIRTMYNKKEVTEHANIDLIPTCLDCLDRLKVEVSNLGFTSMIGNLEEIYKFDKLVSNLDDYVSTMSPVQCTIIKKEYNMIRENLIILSMSDIHYELEMEYILLVYEALHNLICEKHKELRNSLVCLDYADACDIFTQLDYIVINSGNWIIKIMDKARKYYLSAGISKVQAMLIFNLTNQASNMQYAKDIHKCVFLRDNVRTTIYKYITYKMPALYLSRYIKITKDIVLNYDERNKPEAADYIDITAYNDNVVLYAKAHHYDIFALLIEQTFNSVQKQYYRGILDYLFSVGDNYANEYHSGFFVGKYTIALAVGLIDASIGGDVLIHEADMLLNVECLLNYIIHKVYCVYIYIDNLAHILVSILNVRRMVYAYIGHSEIDKSSGSSPDNEDVYVEYINILSLVAVLLLAFSSESRTTSEKERTCAHLYAFLEHNYLILRLLDEYNYSHMGVIRGLLDYINKNITHILKLFTLERRLNVTQTDAGSEIFKYYKDIDSDALLSEFRNVTKYHANSISDTTLVRSDIITFYRSAAHRTIIRTNIIKNIVRGSMDFRSTVCCPSTISGYALMDIVIQLYENKEKLNCVDNTCIFENHEDYISSFTHKYSPDTIMCDMNYSGEQPEIPSETDTSTDFSNLEDYQQFDNDDNIEGTEDNWHTRLDLYEKMSLSSTQYLVVNGEFTELANMKTLLSSKNKVPYFEINDQINRSRANRSGTLLKRTLSLPKDSSAIYKECVENLNSVGHKLDSNESGYVIYQMLVYLFKEISRDLTYISNLYRSLHILTGSTNASIKIRLGNKNSTEFSFNRSKINSAMYQCVSAIQALCIIHKSTLYYNRSKDFRGRIYEDETSIPLENNKILRNCVMPVTENLMFDSAVPQCEILLQYMCRNLSKRYKYCSLSEALAHVKDNFYHYVVLDTDMGVDTSNRNIIMRVIIFFRGVYSELMLSHINDMLNLMENKTCNADVASLRGRYASLKANHALHSSDICSIITLFKEVRVGYIVSTDDTHIDDSDCANMYSILMSDNDKNAILAPICEYINKNELIYEHYLAHDATSSAFQHIFLIGRIIVSITTGNDYIHFTMEEFNQSKGGSDSECNTFLNNKMALQKSIYDYIIMAVDNVYELNRYIAICKKICIKKLERLFSKVIESGIYDVGYIKPAIHNDGLGYKKLALTSPEELVAMPNKEALFNNEYNNVYILNMIVNFRKLLRRIQSICTTIKVVYCAYSASHTGRHRRGKELITFLEQISELKRYTYSSIRILEQYDKSNDLMPWANRPHTHVNTIEKYDFVRNAKEVNIERAI